MGTSLLLLMCILTPVRGIGRNSEVDLHDGENQGHVDHPAAVYGNCQVCEEIVKAAKNIDGPNTSDESLEDAMHKRCNKYGSQDAICKKTLEENIEQLVKEVKTKKDVKTICIDIKACCGGPFLSEELWDRLLTEP